MSWYNARFDNFCCSQVLNVKPTYRILYIIECGIHKYRQLLLFVIFNREKNSRFLQRLFVFRFNSFHKNNLSTLHHIFVNILFGGFLLKSVPLNCKYRRRMHFVTPDNKPNSFHVRHYFPTVAFLTLLLARFESSRNL